MSIFSRIKKLMKRTFRPTQVNSNQYPIFLMDCNKMLVGRMALITGGTSGIGKAIAEAFLNAGASVIITGRDINKLNDVVQELQQHCPSRKDNWIAGLVLDVTAPETFTQKLKESLDLIHKHGNNGLDILVNNAGILGGNPESEEEFENIINTNLKSVYFLSKLISSYMRNNNIRGNILNVESSSGVRPAVNPYSLSKWGLRGLTLGMAKVLIKHGIVVNGIAPGPTATPMLQHSQEGDMTLTSSPSGRYIHPAEIANAAVFLVSGAARMVVGDVLYMTGGAGIVTQDDIKYNF